MTLEQFADLTRDRIPTPAEFLGFVEAQGWRVEACADGTAVLKADASDPVCVALARMLGREPYRTNVLALLPKTDPPSRELTLDEALAQCDRLGVTLRLDGPALRADGPATQELYAMLVPHREAIIERLEQRPPIRPRQWLWPSGATHDEGSGYEPEDVQRYAAADVGSHPGTATHWRYQGETQWRPIER